MSAETFAALATLFEYPSSEGTAAARRFPAFARYWDTTPVERRRQDYVETFDLRKDVSLYLTYAVLGDTRERGVTLARLKALYRAAGFEAAGNELPDFLPLVLDFCSRATAAQARYVLCELRTGIDALHDSLVQRRSAYADLTAALRSLAPKATRSQADAAKAFAQDGAPTELVGR